MRPDIDAVTNRVLAKRARLADPPAGAASLEDIDDELGAGYACALAGDAWSMDLERRLHRLISDTTLEIRAREVRRLALKHVDLQRSIVALRQALAALRRDHDHLRDCAYAGADPGPSARDGCAR